MPTRPAITTPLPLRLLLLTACALLWGCADDPVGEAADAALDASTQGDDAFTQGDDVSTQGLDAPTQGSDTFTQGSDTFTQGSDTFTQGSDTFTQGSDTFTQGDDTFTQGDDTPSTLEDADTSPGDADTSDPPPPTPARYLTDSLRSPINGYVRERLLAIYDIRPDGPRDDVFMKVGASGTVSTRLVHCFAPSPPSGYTYDLDGRAQLQETIDHFRATTPAGATSFDRVTLAAEIGRSASWAISGAPSPLQREVAALNPRFALVNYGTNDMGLGATYESALWPFMRNMTALIDALLAQGIIPIITGLNPRDDLDGARLWAPIYNDATRALAEQYQVPYIDLLRASTPLAGLGMLSDGIHGNSYTVSGGAQPCIFTPEGLGFNYNNRNLLTLEALHDVRAVTLNGAPAPDPDTTPWQGDGSPQSPFLIDRLPFSHSADTAQSPHSLISGYPACDSGQNESGPELYYKLTLTAPTALRVMVFDDAVVDIDLHRLGASGDPASCADRHDRFLQGLLPAGDHTFVLDTFVGGGTPRAGAYLLVVSPCDPDDTTCL
jgi:hypothetical protein